MPAFDGAYFIAKFGAIPDERWIEGELSAPMDRHCALGFTMVGGNWSDESTALCRLFGYDQVSLINDGQDLRYKQPTPKARVLAALRDLPPTP